MEYCQAVKIRDNEISTGEELKRNFLMGRREITNYSALDHAQRLDIIEDAAGKTKGIPIE